MTKLAVVALFLIGACKPDEDYKKQKPPEPAEVKAAAEANKPPPPPPKKVLTPEELGKCDLEVSGAKSIKETTFGGKKAVTVSYWQSEEERGSMSSIDGFVVRCDGQEVKFSMLPGGGKKDGMPFSPKKYDFKKGAGDANVTVFLGPGGKVTMGDPSGTVDITRFDKSRIAGTINLSGKMMPGNGTIKLTGTFDFACPGYANCEQ